MSVIFTKLAPTSYFTLFSAIHSFVIGLLPFYLPILIWQQYQHLGPLTEFIAWTGAGFVMALWGWHQLFTRGYWRTLIVLSFVFELTLIYVALFHVASTNLILLGLLNGLFNCSYWMLQRILFNSISGSNNTGRLFGNLQLILGLSLKLGILFGGYFMQTQPWVIFTLTLIVGISFCVMTLSSLTTQTFIYQQSDHAQPKSALSLRDKLVFLVDGPFLYLESYLWVVSIYHLTNSDTSQFSLTVIALSLALAVIFYFIKNIIDKQPQYRLYQVATLLYLGGWLLRGWISADWSGFAIGLGLLSIAFATALFRLYFNKRFYDKAKQQANYHYLISKSLYSQLGIVLFFTGLSMLSTLTTFSLNQVYWAVIPLIAVYVLYQQVHKPIAQ
jgi:MFS family permease